MLTNDQDKTAVYPSRAAVDPTEPLDTPQTGRNSPVVRAGVVIAILMLLIAAWLVLSMLLPAGDATDTVPSTDGTGAAEAADTEPDGGSEPGASEPTTDPADEPTTAPEDEATTETGNVVDSPLSEVDVPADLVPVVAKIEASIRQLEPSIGAVRISQDVLDFLRSQQPIDAGAVLVDGCTDAHCWIWLHGDALESRVSVTRDGGAMLLTAAG